MTVNWPWLESEAGMVRAPAGAGEGDGEDDAESGSHVETLGLYLQCRGVPLKRSHPRWPLEAGAEETSPEDPGSKMENSWRSNLPFSRWKNRVPKKKSDLPNITKLGSKGTGTRAQDLKPVFYFPAPGVPPSKPPPGPNPAPCSSSELRQSSDSSRTHSHAVSGSSQ